MIEIELQNTDEFYDLDLPSNKQIFLRLKKEYPSEVRDAIRHIKEMHGFTGAKYYNIFDVVSMSELIEEIDDEIDEEILINYSVKDSCGTDRGTQYLILENGYQFLSEVET